MILLKGLSVKGNYRATNEDTIIMRHNKHYCFAGVFDGMGGLADGKVASSSAADNIYSFLKPSLCLPSITHEEMIDLIHQAYCLANNHLFKSACDQGIRMGTTGSITICIREKVYFAHAGDTRIFHLTCSGNITQLSTDHRYEDRKNVLTNAIGIFPKIEVETGVVEILPGESLLLSTDGLHDYFTQAQMKQTLSERSSLSEKLHLMINKAMKDGSQDNASVILLKFTKEAAS